MKTGIKFRLKVSPFYLFKPKTFKFLVGGNPTTTKKAVEVFFESISQYRTSQLLTLYCTEPKHVRAVKKLVTKSKGLLSVSYQGSFKEHEGLLLECY